MNIDKVELAKLIDHTLLKPDASSDDIVRVCEEGKYYGFATVCVYPTWVPLASKLLHDTDIKVDTVIGFPFGATITEVKVFEAQTVIVKGAEEVDMVMNIGALRSGHIDFVRKDLKSVVKVAKENNVISKVIIETCYLTREEKITSCRLVLESGADFVKTSTGFGSGGATVEDVRLLRENVGNKAGVKASGGIRTYQDALKMIRAGASRIGSSSGVKIVESLAC